jgi:mannitol/fructose-specific phosphotransferase system IIA component (Ntr-type)
MRILMSLVEVENIIDNLSYQDKASLVLNLLNKLETKHFIKGESLFENEIISRSKDDLNSFIDSDLVLKEAKSKYY